MAKAVAMHTHTRNTHSITTVASGGKRSCLRFHTTDSKVMAAMMAANGSEKAKP